jgi:hypothetical protein
VKNAEIKNKEIKNAETKNAETENAEQKRIHYILHLKGSRSLDRRIQCSFENVQWNKLVLGRDQYTCRFCGQTKSAFKAYRYKKTFVEILAEFLKEYPQFSPSEEAEALANLAMSHYPFWDIDNSITLCQKCYDSIWEKEKEYLSDARRIDYKDIKEEEDPKKCVIP